MAKKKKKKKKDIEKWCIVKYKNVKEGMYAVSSYGGLMNTLNGSTLHPWLASNGYRYASMMTDENKVLSVGMHVLVCEHFIEKPKELVDSEEKLVPNHKDFDRENNNVNNLEWVTYAMNNKYNRDNGHYSYGENSPTAKSTNEFVHQICKLMEKGYTNKGVAKILGVEMTGYMKGLLTGIRNGHKWKEISSQYNIKNKNLVKNHDDDIIREVCRLLEKGYSTKQIRITLGVTGDVQTVRRFGSFIRSIYRRRSHKEISKDYKW